MRSFVVVVYNFIFEFTDWLFCLWNFLQTHSRAGKMNGLYTRTHKHTHTIVVLFTSNHFCNRFVRFTFCIALAITNFESKYENILRVQAARCNDTIARYQTLRAQQRREKTNGKKYVANLVFNFISNCGKCSVFQFVFCFFIFFFNYLIRLYRWISIGDDSVKYTSASYNVQYQSVECFLLSHTLCVPIVVCLLRWERCVCARIRSHIRFVHSFTLESSI